MFFRKHRAVGYDLPTTGESSGRSSTAESTAKSINPFPRLSRFGKSHTLSDARGVDDPKGPLGLHLLHSPSEPQIDFIFVHGLGGGSRKTWSKTPVLSHYWPQEWLPKDPAFENVRIHSYGYDSDYLKGKEDHLNIHHFGKSLLGEISTSPHFTHSRTHIVAIGHSMGGLVIKKAYILAKQDPAYNNLASRFAAIFFLATPHRGADSAKMLKNLLRAVYNRPYVGDLVRNSSTIQVINDEFRHVSKSLELWSFYETQNMKLFGSPIVDAESAVLGYSEEKQMPMHANHRSICKFEDQSDNNYIILRNALASTVDRILKAIPGLDVKESQDQIKILKKYIGPLEHLEDDLFGLNETRIPESCQWVEAKNSFAVWKAGKSTKDRILLVHGKPGTGKSVLAGYIIETIQASRQPCSYFFFRHGDQSKSSLDVCLRSLAFQMAVSDNEARKAILKLHANDTQIDRADVRTLWRVLFLSGIFGAKIVPHYWVIDALDECTNSLILLDSMLFKMDESIPLRILITSRDSANLNKRLSSPGSNTIQILSVTVADTSSDIKRLVESKIETLALVGREDRSSLTEKILSKSKGSFLWTILVLKEINRCHSKKEVDKVLEDVPKDMESVYKRILDLMSQSTRGKQLAKATLLWTVHAVRPLTVNELSYALTLDIQDSFPRLEDSITALCGQLVTIDKHGRIQMLHETAREFFLDDELDSEFAIDKMAAHTRMAQACLTYLSGDEMKPPRTHRRSSAVKRADFASYACTAYAYHLSKADPKSTDLFHIVTQFLKSNVLTWIEVIASRGNLTELTRASAYLEIYTQMCSVERSPLDPRIQSLQQWAIDLVRIAAKFATALSTSPSAVYWLIPPFCPSDSMLYNIAGQSQRLSVLGTLDKQWDDRMLCIHFREGQPISVCYGDKYLAVGLITGIVTFYSTISFQKYTVLNHGEAVKFIRFGGENNLVATCGSRKTMIWDIESGEVIYSFDNPHWPLDVVFDGTQVLIVDRGNNLRCWDLRKATRLGEVIRSNDLQAPTSTQFDGPLPVTFRISASHKILAAVYTWQPIKLWDLEENSYIGSCGKRLSDGKISTHAVVDLTFNPSPDIRLLAAAYLDGDLALIDPFSNRQLECFRANCQTLTASPNGRLLGASVAGGVINVYEFHTLKLLYRLSSSGSFAEEISFSGDSLRLADIRGFQCNIWEPTALLRDGSIDGGGRTTEASTVKVVPPEAQKIITILVHPTAEVVFCGREDGAVVLYASLTAEYLITLYNHKSPVFLLKWCDKRNAILSADASNKIFLYEVEKSPTVGWLAGATMIFQSRLASELAVVDILLDGAAEKSIVSTRDSDHLFMLTEGGHEISRVHQSRPRKWILHPTSSAHMIYIDRSTARIHRWADWSEFETLFWSVDIDTAWFIKSSTYSIGEQRRILLELGGCDGSIRTGGLIVLNADCFSNGNGNNDSKKEPSSGEYSAEEPVFDEEAKAVKTVLRVISPLGLGPRVATFAHNVAQIIGVDDSGRLVFLDHSSWVCSCDLEESVLQANPDEPSPSIEYVRHFFVPYDLYPGRGNAVCALMPEGVFLARGGSLMLIRGYSEHAERFSVQYSDLRGAVGGYRGTVQIPVAPDEILQFSG